MAWKMSVEGGFTLPEWAVFMGNSAVDTPLPFVTLAPRFSRIPFPNEHPDTTQNN